MQVRAQMPIGGPAFVVRTRHHSPPTYVGATFEQRSAVFAFNSRRLAARVAHGIEKHRRASGAFPVLTLDGMTLDDVDAPDALEHLDIVQLEPYELEVLVSGSGVIVCYMRLDDEESDIHAHIVYDRKIQRTFLWDVFNKD